MMLHVGGYQTSKKDKDSQKQIKQQQKVVNSLQKQENDLPISYFNYSIDWFVKIIILILHNFSITNIINIRDK